MMRSTDPSMGYSDEDRSTSSPPSCATPDVPCCVVAPTCSQNVVPLMTGTRSPVGTARSCTAVVAFEGALCAIGLHPPLPGSEPTVWVLVQSDRRNEPATTRTHARAPTMTLPLSRVTGEMYPGKFSSVVPNEITGRIPEARLPANGAR